MAGPNCGNNPNFQLSEGDRKAVEEFLAYLAGRKSKTETIVRYTKCESCQWGSCCDEPTPHPWAGPDDIEHARTTGQSEPTGNCACTCAQPAEQAE